MVMCTQRSDLWYRVQNTLNNTVRKKNWVSRWSTPIWGGKCILSVRVSWSCKLKEISSQDELWSIMNNSYQWKLCSRGVTLSQVFKFGMPVMKLKGLSRYFPLSLRGFEPLPNLEDEIHFKGGRIVTPKICISLK